MVSDSKKTIKNQDLVSNDDALPEKFGYKKNVVAIVKLDDYNSENIKKSLEKIYDLLELKEFFKNKTVFVKPNILAPTKLAYTEPKVISEVIKSLNSNAKDILIGDSTMTKGLTNLTLKMTKIKEDSESLGARVINFFEGKRSLIKLKKPSNESEEGIYLPEEIINSDIIINVPKLKTHKGYIYTGAIKNFFGLLGNKMNMHFVHKNKLNFQKMLADIYFAVEETNETNMPKVLTIMDAVIAMEGKGPRAGKPRKVGLLIAGFNSAAVDIVGYTLMNGKPQDLEAINSIARRTNLPVDISKLEIIGERDYKQYIVKNFKKPNVATFKKSQVPQKGLLSKISTKMMSISIKINPKKCVLCEQCVKHCPAEAMVRKDERIFVDSEKCVQCFCCGESCPNDAINTKWYLFRIMPYLLILIGILGMGLVFGIVLLIQFLISFF